MNKNLLIVGTGQCGQVAKEIAEAMCCFEKIDFIDDNINIAIGKLCDYKEYSDLYSYATVAIDNPEFRLKWINKLEEACYKIAILVHPKAYVSPSAQIMKGCIIEPMSVINTKSVIAVGCIISAGAVVNHAAMCCDGCQVDCNATVAENTLVPAGTHISSGEIYKNDNISANDLFFNTEKWAKKLSEIESRTSHGPTPINGREYCFEDGM